MVILYRNERSGNTDCKNQTIKTPNEKAKQRNAKISQEKKKRLFSPPESSNSKVSCTKEKFKFQVKQFQKAEILGWQKQAVTGFTKSPDYQKYSGHRSKKSASNRISSKDFVSRQKQRFCTTRIFPTKIQSVSKVKTICIVPSWIEIFILVPMKKVRKEKENWKKR